MTDTQDIATLEHDADGVVLEPEIEARQELALPPLEQSLAQHMSAPKARDFMPVPMEDIMETSNILQHMPGIGKEFQGNINSTAAVVLQAAEWRVSAPFLLRHAYQTKQGGPIGYEGKVINAVILANAPLSRRPRYQFGYGGDGKRTAMNRFCKVIFHVIGEDEPFTLTSPTVAQIKVKNSPEWFSHTDKQLIYYIGRAGANAYFPDVLAGAYSREEVQYLRDMDRKSDVSNRRLFDDDAIEADFEDAILPTDADAKAFERAEAKASGQQDSRDPRDAPQNQKSKGPTPPPQGGGEPEDMPEVRQWAAAEQKRLLAIPEAKGAHDAWQEFIKDKRWDRLRTYCPEVAKVVKASIAKHIDDMKAG